MTDNALNPAPTTIVSAPADDESYISAATSAAKSVSETPKPAAEAAPKNETSEKPKLEAPKAEAPPSDSIKRSFEKLAQKSQELRQREEGVRHAEKLASRLGPQGLHELAAALESGDPMALLRAARIDPSKMAPADPQSQKQESPEYLALKQEVEALRNERQQERYQSGRSKALSDMAAMAKADSKFALASEFDHAAEEALDLVEEYIRKNGSLPAETREESMRLGLEVVEERLAAEAAKWERALTKRKGVSTVAPVGSPEQSSRSESVSRSLSDSTAATPARGATTLQTDEDYIAAAAALLKQSR